MLADLCTIHRKVEGMTNFWMSQEAFLLWILVLHVDSIEVSTQVWSGAKVLPRFEVGDELRWHNVDPIEDAREVKLQPYLPTPPTSQ